MTKDSRRLRSLRSTCRFRAQESRCTIRRDSKSRRDLECSARQAIRDRSRRRFAASRPRLAAGSSAAWSGGRSTEDTDRVALKALVDRYQNESGGRTVVGSLPVRVAFPELGPSLFLAAGADVGRCSPVSGFGVQADAMRWVMRNFTFAAILASFVTHALAASAQPAPQRPASGPRLAEAATAMPVVPAGTVTLTLAEYDRLVDLSARPVRPPEVPPVGAVLSRADLRVRVDGVAARGTFTIDGEVLRAGTDAR